MPDAPETQPSKFSLHYLVKKVMNCKVLSLEFDQNINMCAFLKSRNLESNKIVAYATGLTLNLLTGFLPLT